MKIAPRDESSRVVTSSPTQEVGRAYRPVSALVRYPITLQSLRDSRSKPRRRCIHPKGHHGPHWFGEVPDAR